MYVPADGERVRELREEQGATTDEVARRAGITRRTLRKVERNEGPVGVDTARGIAALDVDPRTFARAISRRQSRQ